MEHEPEYTPKEVDIHMNYSSYVAVAAAACFVCLCFILTSIFSSLQFHFTLPLILCYLFIIFVHLLRWVCVSGCVYLHAHNTKMSFSLFYSLSVHYGNILLQLFYKCFGFCSVFRFHRISNDCRSTFWLYFLVCYIHLIFREGNWWFLLDKQLFCCEWLLARHISSSILCGILFFSDNN